MKRGSSAQQTLHAQRHGNQAVAGSNDTQREGPVNLDQGANEEHPRGREGYGRQGPKSTKNKYKQPRHYAYVAQQRAKTRGKTTISRDVTGGKGGRRVVSSVLRQGISETVASSSMIVRQRLREHALMQ